MLQKSLFQNLAEIAIHSTHSGGRGEPLHDWYPYLEGFSSKFVTEVIDTFFEKQPDSILEPFGGVGTTPLTLWSNRIRCDFCEVNPFLQLLIQSKKFACDSNPTELINGLKIAIKQIHALDKYEIDSELAESYKYCFHDSEYFTEEAFVKALRLSSFCDQANPKINMILRVLCASVLLKGSKLRRAGDVRYKTPRELSMGIPDLAELVAQKLDLALNDAYLLSDLHIQDGGRLVAANAKELKTTMIDQEYDGVITSPPYLNGTNYIRNTKLELWFCKLIGPTGSNLRDFRNAVVTSAINDVTKAQSGTCIKEARPTVTEVEQNCYDARIPKMVSEYFSQMALVFEGLLKHCKAGAPICIDIGDSVYNGVHVKTDEVLTEIMLNRGASLIENVYLRKRTSNRGASLSQRLLVFSKNG